MKAGRDLDARDARADVLVEGVVGDGQVDRRADAAEQGAALAAARLVPTAGGRVGHALSGFG